MRVVQVEVYKKSEEKPFGTLLSSFELPMDTPKNEVEAASYGAEITAQQMLGKFGASAETHVMYVPNMPDKAEQLADLEALQAIEAAGDELPSTCDILNSIQQ